MTANGSKQKWRKERPERWILSNVSRPAGGQTNISLSCSYYIQWKGKKQAMRGDPIRTLCNEMINSYVTIKKRSEHPYECPDLIGINQVE